jgi:hypothetical protein
MAWTPTNKVINTRIVASNILSFIAANQTEALTWANGATGLIAFQDINDSVANRSNPIFPAIALEDDDDETDYTGDILQPLYRVKFEIMVQSADPSAAVTKARIYDLAVKSMIRNMTAAELTDGLTDINAVLLAVESGFEPMQANEQQNSFLQVFQIRATFRLTGAAL